MSKKKFSQGLSELLDDIAGSPGDLEQIAQTPTAAPRKHGHKNFFADLESLMEEAMRDGEAQREADEKQASYKSKSEKAQAGLAGGLDMLIRQTISFEERNAAASDDKRRITVLVDRQKAERLKQIARTQNAFMKDLIARMIESYIESFQERQSDKASE